MMTTADVFTWFISAIASLSIIAFVYARFTAIKIEQQEGRLHSRPNFFGWYAVSRLCMPTLGLAFLYSIFHMAGLINSNLLLFCVSFGAGFIYLFLGLKHLHKDFRARQAVEKVSRRLFFLAALISIFTTLGIVFSVLFEAFRFFAIVPLWDFLTGTSGILILHF